MTVAVQHISSPSSSSSSSSEVPQQFHGQNRLQTIPRPRPRPAAATTSSPRLELFLSLQVALLLLAGLGVGMTQSMQSTVPGEGDITGWEDVFRTRDEDDWRRVWHGERHRRCFSDLLSHMDWVCEKDIYKAKEPLRLYQHQKRSIPDAVMEGQAGGDVLLPGDARKVPLSPHDWSRNRNRRSGHPQKRGILDECCHGPAGCSWEEYAEYCPANRRIRTL